MSDSRHRAVGSAADRSCLTAEQQRIMATADVALARAGGKPPTLTTVPLADRAKTATAAAQKALQSLTAPPLLAGKPAQATAARVPDADAATAELGQFLCKLMGV